MTKQVYHLAPASVVQQAIVLKKQRRFREALELLYKRSYEYHIDEQAGSIKIDNCKENINSNVSRWSAR